MEGDLGYAGTRQSSIPLIVEVHSDDDDLAVASTSRITAGISSNYAAAAAVIEDETQWTRYQQQHQHQHQSLQAVQPPIFNDKSTNQRRMSQVSMGSDFDGMAEHLEHTTSTTNNEDVRIISSISDKSSYYRKQQQQIMSNNTRSSPNSRSKSGHQHEVSIIGNRSNSSESSSSDEDVSRNKRQTGQLTVLSLPKRLAQLKARQSNAEQVLIQSRSDSPAPTTKTTTITSTTTTRKMNPDTMYTTDTSLVPTIRKMNPIPLSSRNHNSIATTRMIMNLRRKATRESSPLAGVPPAVLAFQRTKAIHDPSPVPVIALWRNQDASPILPSRRKVTLNSNIANSGSSSASSNRKTTNKTAPSFRRTALDHRVERAASLYGNISSHDKHKHKHKRNTRNFSERLKLAKESETSSLDYLSSSRHTSSKSRDLERDDKSDFLDQSSHYCNAESVTITTTAAATAEMEESMNSLTSSGSAVPANDTVPALAAAAATNRSRRIRKHTDRKNRLHKVLRKMNATVSSVPPPGQTSLLPLPVQDYQAVDAVETPVFAVAPSAAVLLEPSNNDLQASFSNVGGYLTTHGQEYLEHKLPAKRMSDLEIVVPVPSTRFPSIVSNLGAAAFMPSVGFVMGAKTITAGLLEDDSDDEDDYKCSVRYGKADDADGALTNESDHSITLRQVIEETTKEQKSASAGPTPLMLHSVASDILLEPSHLVGAGDTMEGDALSSSWSLLEKSLTSVNSNTVTSSETTTRSWIRKESMGSVVEEIPQQDAITFATPFFGAALRQLQVLPKMPGPDANDSSGSVSSFANDDGSVASSSLNPTDVAVQNLRDSQLGKIDETLGNESRASGNLSFSCSEELDAFDAVVRPNPMEERLNEQRNGMYTDHLAIGRRDSMLSISSIQSTSSQGTRKSSIVLRSVPRASGGGRGRRSSMLVSPLLRMSKASFRNDRSQQDLKFSSGQDDLEKVQIDDSLPPETTRRATWKGKRRASVANSITDSFTIESASTAMASLGEREERTRARRLSENSKISGGSSAVEPRDTRSETCRNEFAEFRADQLVSDDDLKSVASSMYSSVEKKQSTKVGQRPQRSASMYHSKDAENALETAERNERAWAAMFHGHGVMLESTGQRPVLTRMYVYAAAAGVVAICMLITLVLLNQQQKIEDPNDASDSFCANKDIAESLRRCPCNNTESSAWDKDFLQRYEEVRDILLKVGVADSGDLVESCTSENVAMQWLAEDPWDLNSDIKLTVQRYVFGFLFLQLEGLSWKDHTGWMTELDVCDWLGSSCSRSLVTGMDLTNNNLQGGLPSKMAELMLLTSLRFGQNELTGSLPESLSNLSNLVELDMTGNHMSGDFDTALFSSLENLMFQSNLLQGSLEGIQKLTRLEVMILSCNGVSGTLPTEIGKVTNLRVLELANNRLVGEIPSELSNLSRLQALDLTGNQFIGTVPENICANLVFLEALLVDCSKALVIDDCPCCHCEPEMS